MNVNTLRPCCSIVRETEAERQMLAREDQALYFVEEVYSKRRDAFNTAAAQIETKFKSMMDTVNTYPLDDVNRSQLNSFSAQMEMKKLEFCGRIEQQVQKMTLRSITNPGRWLKEMVLNVGARMSKKDSFMRTSTVIHPSCFEVFSKMFDEMIPKVKRLADGDQFFQQSIGYMKGIEFYKHQIRLIDEFDSQLPGPSNEPPPPQARAEPPTQLSACLEVMSLLNGPLLNEEQAALDSEAGVVNGHLRMYDRDDARTSNNSDGQGCVELGGEMYVIVEEGGGNDVPSCGVTRTTLPLSALRKEAGGDGVAVDFANRHMTAKTNAHLTDMVRSCMGNESRSSIGLNVRISPAATRGRPVLRSLPQTCGGQSRQNPTPRVNVPARRPRSTFHERVIPLQARSPKVVFSTPDVMSAESPPGKSIASCHSAPAALSANSDGRLLRLLSLRKRTPPSLAPKSLVFDDIDVEAERKMLERGLHPMAKANKTVMPILLKRGVKTFEAVSVAVKGKEGNMDELKPIKLSTLGSGSFKPLN